MEARYLNYWSRDQMISDFEITEADLEGCEILLASYVCESYEGSAFVLFRKGGELFQVSGSHCSCYGLEGQWTPERTAVAALRMYLAEGGYDVRDYADDLRAVLDELDATTNEG